MILSSRVRCADTKTSYAVKIGLPLASIVVIIAFTLAVFTQEASSSKAEEAIEVSCTANGDIRVITQGKNPRIVNPHWDPSLFLSITFGFGRFTYAAAKGIDICWDFVVGRFGQILLAIVSYPILRRSLLNCLEKDCVSFSHYSCLAFDKISLAALCATVSSFFRGTQTCDSADGPPKTFLRWRFSWNYLGHIVILLYILAFPTLISVMTGYQTAYTPYVRRPDDQFLVDVSQLQIPNFVVVDGDRVGMQKFQPINPGDRRIPDLHNYTEKIYQNLDGFLGFACEPGTKEYKISCDMPYHIDSKTCAFMMACEAPHARPGEPLPTGDPFHLHSKLTTSNITIDGKLYTLEAPPLDIISQVSLYAMESPSRINYMSYNNLSFSSTYLQENGVCQPTALYQWGFSSLVLLVFCLLTTIFAATLTALNGHVFWTSRADRFRYDISHYKDAVDISKELDNVGLAAGNMPARQLRQELKRRDIGLFLDTDNLPRSRKVEWQLIWKERKADKMRRVQMETQQAKQLEKAGDGGTLDESPGWVKVTMRMLGI